jgi:Glycosyl transferase family 11
MSRKTKQKVEIELVGGLGNQLFGYFAGAYYAQKFNKHLIVDLTQVSLGLTNHGSELTSFKFSKSYELIRSKPRGFARLIKRVFDKLSIKFKFIKYFRYRLLGVYQSKEVGFDSFLEKQSEISRIQGYYQTWKYVNTLQELEADISLEIINPSNWFLELQNEINKVKPIVIHVRRGDYKNPNSPVGLLSRSYYQDAIGVVNNKYENRNFWIFSDDIEDSQKLLDGLIPKSSNWICPPTGSDPAESLVLMSLSKVIIIANSSFSWWAAKTGVEKELVIAPSPWFRKLDEPSFLMPESWKQVKSSWM